MMTEGSDRYWARASDSNRTVERGGNSQLGKTHLHGFLIHVSHLEETMLTDTLQLPDLHKVLKSVRELHSSFAVSERPGLLIAKQQQQNCTMFQDMNPNRTLQSGFTSDSTDSKQSSGTGVYVSSWPQSSQTMSILNM